MLVSCVVDEPRECASVYADGDDQQQLQHHRHPQRKRTIFRHLFVSRASRKTLRTASLAGVETAAHGCSDADGALASPRRTASGPPSTRPGPRTMASTMRRSSRSSPGISSRSGPRDITSTLSHRPDELERVARLDQQSAPGVGPRAQAPGRCRSGTRRRRPGRLVGEDHGRLPEERARDSHLLLVPAREELDRLLERRRADLRAGRQILHRDRAPRRRRKPSTAEAAQRLDRGVDAHAEHRHQRLRLRSPGQQHDPGRTASCVEVSISSLPSQSTRPARGGCRPARQSKSSGWPLPFGARDAHDLAALQREADGPEGLALEPVDHQHLRELVVRRRRRAGTQPRTDDRRSARPGQPPSCRSRRKSLGSGRRAGP